jgi:hypothetical protein
MCIHLNPHVLEWNGMEWNLVQFHSNPLQHMWIEMNACASKQGLKETAAGVARDLWDYSRNIQGDLFGEENLEDAGGGT